MQLPGFNAEVSLGNNAQRFEGRAVERGYDRSSVTAQGCPPWVAVGCVAAIAACAASCATVVGCAACFAGIGASNCLSCVQ